MSAINITINGKMLQAQEGEYVLDIARRNDIFIPAICYMTRCSPTLACRLCIVDADGKRVYACNAKAKEGMSVVTSTPEIEQERKAIMQVYDVNHPLQCGVCDQSGECELQNYTLEMGVETQRYAIKDTKRDIKDWGLIKYDAALCIVCERCVTICKDMIGDAALKSVPRGGDALDKELKESMPKDAYAMWNKMQKSLIGAVAGEMLECTNCGECIEVCPVGALTSSDFEYTTNAWELNQIPASCSHCSAACHLYYEVKHESVSNPNPKIYRVTNEFHYVSLCAAGRFGYDYENKNGKRDGEVFAKAVSAFEKADTIIFDSFITNEEALILQKLKEKKGYKLVNSDALAYKRFLEGFGSLYSGTLQDIHDAEFIVSVGTMLKNDNPRARYALNNALTLNKGSSAVYFHPVGDKIIKGLSKNITQQIYAPLEEERVLELILKVFSKDESLPAGGLWEGPQNANGMDDAKEKLTAAVEKQNKVLILGADLYNHPRAKEIAALARKIEGSCGFKVVIIPSQTNTLGVSLICDLDEQRGGYTVGINQKGDFTLSALGDGDMDIASLNQQEGTFTNIDKMVVPTKPALPFSGYTLAEIANTILGTNKKATIEYTKELPTSKGYRCVEFDALPNGYNNDWSENRGYRLVMGGGVNGDEVVGANHPSPITGHQLIYLCNPVEQFSGFTNKAHQLKTEAKAYMSSEYMSEKGLSEGDTVEIKANGNSVSLKVALDKFIEGNIVLIPDFDTTKDTRALFGGYRFTKAEIRRV